MAKVKVQTRSADSLSLVGLQISSSGVICPAGYHRLSDAPEVAAAVWWISDMVSTMTIQLMRNGPSGDTRVRDALARKVDVVPWSLGTRQTLMGWITATMLLQGDAFVLPRTAAGYLQDLIPMPGARAQLRPDGEPYEVVWKGLAFDPDEVLHFALRPDLKEPWHGCGLQVQLQQVVDSIMQTGATKLAYMSSEYKPPMIVAVNADSDLSDDDARQRFVDSYLKRSDPSAPLVIPADLLTVSQVRPLSLTDLAIKDGIELDKRDVAAIVGVPGYVVGVGEFSKGEHNAFIRTKFMYYVTVIQQELTKKLLLSPDEYFRLNARSLYAYDLQELANIALNLSMRGLMTGNEVRNWMGLSPKEGLDELTILENYIPLGAIADQSKLSGNDNDKGGNA